MLFTKSGPKPEPENFERVIARLDEQQGLASSGALVTPTKAMQQATAYACVRIISEAIAGLEPTLWRRNGGEWVQVENHPVIDLWHRPNNWMTSHEFWALALMHQELRGNFYSYKVRGGNGRVSELLPLMPTGVTVEQLYDWSIRYYVADKRARVSGTHSPREIFHCKWISDDGVVGIPTITYHRESIGLALQTERHGASMFRNGTTLGLIFKHPGHLKQEAADRLRQGLQKFRGATNAGKNLVIEDGMTVEKLGMTADDAQFLETRQFQREEIASIFGVPPFMLGMTEKSTTWGSGLETILRQFVTQSLQPRIDRLEQSLERHFLSESEQRTHEIRIDTDQLTRGTLGEQLRALGIGTDRGILSINEARSKIKMNAIENGDEHRVPMNTTPAGTSDENETP